MQQCSIAHALVPMQVFVSAAAPVDRPGSSIGASPDYTALRDRLSVLAGNSSVRSSERASATRFLQPGELDNMLAVGLQHISCSWAQTVWNIEDIPPSSLTAGWMAWYYGIVPDKDRALDEASLKKLKFKLHPDKVMLVAIIDYAM